MFQRLESQFPLLIHSNERKNVKTNNNNDKTQIDTSNLLANHTFSKTQSCLFRDLVDQREETRDNRTLCGAMSLTVVRLWNTNVWFSCFNSIKTINNIHTYLIFLLLSLSQSPSFPLFLFINQSFHGFNHIPIDVLSARTIHMHAPTGWRFFFRLLSIIRSNTTTTQNRLHGISVLFFVVLFHSHRIDTPLPHSI